MQRADREVNAGLRGIAATIFCNRTTATLRFPSVADPDMILTR